MRTYSHIEGERKHTCERGGTTTIERDHRGMCWLRYRPMQVIISRQLGSTDVGVFTTCRRRWSPEHDIRDEAI